MGVGLYVNEERYAGWSYSGFHSFRKMLAKELGIDLNKMEGFCGVEFDHEKMSWAEYMDARAADALTDKISWESISEPNLWEDAVSLTDRPRDNIRTAQIKALVPFLHHSDCDGEIAPELCGPMADAIEGLIEGWAENLELRPVENLQRIGYPPSMCIANYDKQQARGLVAGLREAAKTGKPLVFC